MQIVTKGNLENFTEKLLQNDKKIYTDIKGSMGIKSTTYKNWLYGDSTEFASHIGSDISTTTSGTRFGKITNFPTNGTIYIKMDSEGFEGNLKLVDKNQKSVLVPILKSSKESIYEIDFTGFDTSYILFYLLKSANSPTDIANIKNIALVENTNKDEDRVIMDKIAESNFEAEFIVTTNKLMDKLESIENSNKPIVMIGDSIAARIGVQFTKDKFDGREYYMNAIGGQTVLDTVGQLGAVPYLVLPFTIPASGSVSVEIISSDFLKVDYDSSATPTYSNGYLSNYSSTGLYPTGEMKCKIAEIEGVLKFTRSSAGSTFTTTFTRNTAGNSVVLTRPYEVIPTDAPERNSILLCFMGTNGGWCDKYHTGEPKAASTIKDMDYLISLYKRIRDYIKPISNDYLFLGFYMNAGVDQHTDEERKALWNYFEQNMMKEFGQNYFSVREYLRTYGYEEAGLTLTSDDITEILAGKIPYTSTCSDNVHLTDTVAKCVGNKILERLKELGSIKSYTKLV